MKFERREERPLARLGYFTRAALAEALPLAFHRRALAARLERLSRAPLDPVIAARVAYCCKLKPDQPKPTRRLGDVSRREGSTYYIDLMAAMRGYGPETRVDVRFGRGDINGKHDDPATPERPTLMKSRVILDDNAPAVLMPFNRFRHFHFPQDPVSFAAKRPGAVWRGRLNSAVRKQAVAAHHDNPRHDIGHVDAWRELPGLRPWLSHRQQFDWRYNLILEGNDIITNIKWVMGSNSVAIGPRMRNESWFLEGQLRPGVHYIETRDDLADLDDRIAAAEADPEGTRAIVAAANDWCRQFADPAREADIALLVAQKYLEMTGQMPSDALPYRLFDAL